jgi:HD superfamily phosphohydrolase YqeK
MRKLLNTRYKSPLKKDVTPLDLVLFVADKIVWDQPGEAPWAHAMKAALCQDDLQKAARIYLDFLRQNQAQMPGPLHPWAWQAWQ